MVLPWTLKPLLRIILFFFLSARQTRKTKQVLDISYQSIHFRSVLVEDNLHIIFQCNSPLYCLGWRAKRQIFPIKMVKSISYWWRCDVFPSIMACFLLVSEWYWIWLEVCSLPLSLSFGVFLKSRHCFLYRFSFNRSE